MNKFTVISFYDESGQIVCDHVTANSGSHAFALVAKQRPGCTLVSAVKGHLTEASEDIAFPGEGVVDAETVMEQPDVFSQA